MKLGLVNMSKTGDGIDVSDIIIYVICAICVLMVLKWLKKCYNRRLRQAQNIIQPTMQPVQPAMQPAQPVQFQQLHVPALPQPIAEAVYSNFYARYTYGNRNNRGLKLSHWNAGSAFLQNKKNEIETLIADHHPHLLGISEANLHKDHNLGSCMIDDYELFTCLTMDNLNLQTSRVVVYKHSSLVAKIRKDLMSDKFSSVWLEVGFPGRTKILVCNLYRDWQYLGQADHSSLEIAEQLVRWNIFLDQWEVYPMV